MSSHSPNGNGVDDGDHRSGIANSWRWVRQRSMPSAFDVLDRRRLMAGGVVSATVTGLAALSAVAADIDCFQVRIAVSVFHSPNW